MARPAAGLVPVENDPSADLIGYGAGGAQPVSTQRNRTIHLSSTLSKIDQTD